jgi:hypothetical protein
VILEKAVKQTKAKQMLKIKHTSKNLSNSDLKVSLWSKTESGSFRNQQSTNGCKPRILGSKYTMPQRLTVAGDATARSCTSNIIVIDWK